MSQQDWKNARTVIVSIRLSPQEAAHIDTAGAALNYPRRRADFVRAAALAAARQKAPPPARVPRLPLPRKPALDVEQLTRILGLLGKLGGPIIQLTENRKENTPSASALKALAEEIATIRELVIEALRGRGRDH